MKAEAARIFKAAWAEANDDPTYQRLRAEHRAKDGGCPYKEIESASAGAAPLVDAPPGQRF